MSGVSGVGRSVEPDEGLFLREVAGEAEAMMAGAVEHRDNLTALAGEVVLVGYAVAGLGVTPLALMMQV
jgi:hypothetical protein